MFDIRFDKEQRVLHLAARGIWTMGVHARFASTLIAQATYARARYGHFAVLADVREHPVQPAELNGPSQALVQRAITITNGPIAVVVGSMLGKIQAERVLGGPRVRIFLDRDAAEDWVLSCWIGPQCGGPGAVSRDAAAI